MVAICDLQTGLVLSPAVWRKSTKEWFMWTTNGNMIMNLYKSSDGLTWSSGQLRSAPWDTWNGGGIFLGMYPLNRIT